MYIIVSIILFFVVTITYVLIIDIFTALFMITGLSDERARFQTISLLTNSGFTTQASEAIVGDRTRRRLGRVIMIFGNVFGMTTISVFINLIIALPSAQVHVVWPPVLAVVVAFVAFLLIKRIPAVKRGFNARLLRWAQKRMYGHRDNVITVIDEYPKGVVAEISMEKVPKELQGKTIAEIGMKRNYDVLLILLRRKNQFLSLEELPGIVLEQGDSMLAFGKAKDIRKLFAHTHKAESTDK